MMVMVFFMSLILSVALIILNSTISKKSFTDREKISPFECGFDPTTSSRIPFSLRFYLVALIFLIFDVEITLILPVPLIIKYNTSSSMIILISFFILILAAGLFHEWNQGALEWHM